MARKWLRGNSILLTRKHFCLCWFPWELPKTRCREIIEVILLSKQPPLSVENMPVERKWKTSLIGGLLFVCCFSLIGGLLATRFSIFCFFSGESSNLAMVVHKCEGDPLPKLQFFLNERPIDLDGCPQGSCSSATFLNQHAIKGSTGHTFEEACKTQKKQGGENSSSLPYSVSPGQSSSWPRD